MRVFKLGDWELHITVNSTHWYDEEIAHERWIAFTLEHLTPHEKKHRAWWRKMRDKGII